MSDFTADGETAFAEHLAECPGCPDCVTPTEHGQERIEAGLHELAERIIFRRDQAVGIEKRAILAADANLIDDAVAVIQQAADRERALEDRNRRLVDELGRRDEGYARQDEELYAALDRIQSPETPADPG
jgi:hypothetical protein